MCVYIYIYIYVDVCIHIIAVATNHNYNSSQRDSAQGRVPVEHQGRPQEDRGRPARDAGPIQVSWSSHSKVSSSVNTGCFARILPQFVTVA